MSLRVGLSDGDQVENSGGIHRCRATDAFRLENGQVVRDDATAFWREMLDTVIVDVVSGVVRAGNDGLPVKWQIVQKTEPGWDFVAVKSGPHETVLSTLRIRNWENPIQVLITLNGFLFIVGTCQIIAGDTPLTSEE